MYDYNKRIENYSLNLCISKSKISMKEAINRIKIVLAEKNRTNKWLAEQLGKNVSTVSKWCTNSSQPSLEVLPEIARVLDVDVRDLLCKTYNKH